MPQTLWSILALTIAILMTRTTAAGAPRLLNNIEYTQVAGTSLRFDASIPDTPNPAPAVIIVHGGGWVRGDRRTNVELLFEPLTKAGFAWFSISYTLASNPLQLGTAVTDVEAAIAFIHERASAYHIDPDRIAILGESAGGQLASMAALSPQSGKKIKAVVAFYTPTDMVDLARNSTMIPEGIRSQLNGTPWERIILGRLAQMSPLAAIRKDMPPFLFIHGDSDRLVPLAQSQAMCDKMKSVGASCKIVTVPGAGHGLQWWESSPERSQPYKRELVEWLTQQLAPSGEIPAAY